MKAITISLSVILFALVLASGVKAEIYETVDKEGNPVFSDTPSQGAKEVELPAENIADAPPPSTRPAEPAREPLSEQDVKQHKTWKDQVGEDGQERTFKENKRSGTYKGTETETEDTSVPLASPFSGLNEVEADISPTQGHCWSIFKQSGRFR
jgi:hypothetical protein